MTELKNRQSLQRNKSHQIKFSRDLPASDVLANIEVNGLGDDYHDVNNYHVVHEDVQQQVSQECYNLENELQNTDSRVT